MLGNILIFISLIVIVIWEAYAWGVDIIISYILKRTRKKH
jgi:hypothetical protein